MAISSPSASPAITVKEIDLSGYVPNVQSTTGAFVGNFRWGPVRQRTLVDSEATLAEIFATPSATTAVDFISASQYLTYSGSMFVVREATAAAVNANASGANNIQVRNKDHYDQLTLGTDSGETNVGLWMARYPGALGNSLKVSMISANGNFASWTYANEFDGAPSTSSYASTRTGSNDEVHVVVIDEDGKFSGTPGTILERYAYLSVASDARTADGTDNYVANVINNASNFIFFGSWDSAAAFTNAGSAAAGVTFNASATHLDSSMTLGVDSAALTTSEFLTGFALYDDPDIVQVDFLIAPGMASSADQTTVVNYLSGVAKNLRKDCIVVASPNRAAVINNADPVTASTTAVAGFNATSYLVIDNNYLKVYDKYNDGYIFIPAASTTAGVMASTDLQSAAWFSPAGQRRGQYFGVTALAYSPTKSQRDTLYKAGINPVVNIPGQGVLLFGDKTYLGRPSAFDRINVRRLFLVIERAIARAAKNVMFEFNDEFTRAEFVNVVEPFLREIQGRRGITDFRVVCDSTNNTAAVIDRNEFIANIFIKPARSINYVTLNFVAVRTGVDFEEVVGAV